MFGFLRKQEINLAMRLIAWRYENAGHPPPPADELRASAEHVVAEAHRIARKSGGNVMKIMKDLVADIRK